MTAKEKEDAINELTAYIHCLKCDRSGKVCDDNCPTQYEAGNCGEIIKNLEFLLEEVKKMPTLFKSAYNLLAYYEPLEPCEDAISRQAVLDGLASIAKAKAKSDAQKSLMGRVMFFTEQLPPVTPKQKMGRWINSHIPESTLCECSECGFTCGAYSFNYCPNCGAEMQEVEE